MPSDVGSQSHIQSEDLGAASRSVFVARACDAWESGWSLVVEITCQTLAQRAADEDEFVTLCAEFAELKRKSDQQTRVSDIGAELENLRAQFRRYYREVHNYVDGLPDAEETEPWDCGRVKVSPASSDRWGNMGNWGVRICPELDWGAEEWRENVLRSMQQHAAEWRWRFNRLKRVEEPRVGGEESEAGKLTAPTSKGERQATEVLTEPMTIQDLAKYFGVHRNKMTEILATIEGVARSGGLVRVPISQMPPKYHVEKGLM
ncbi:MAG: hypothetical protein H8E66_33970 [Planctomycetes bacterium]|nr:hypothetical protein [Planctomycetota bacterium]